VREAPTGLETNALGFSKAVAKAPGSRGWLRQRLIHRRSAGEVDLRTFILLEPEDLHGG
jgi:hypothetical protein